MAYPNPVSLLLLNEAFHGDGLYFGVGFYRSLFTQSGNRVEFPHYYSCLIIYAYLTPPLIQSGYYVHYTSVSQPPGPGISYTGQREA